MRTLLALVISLIALPALAQEATLVAPSAAPEPVAAGAPIPAEQPAPVPAEAIMVTPVESTPAPVTPTPVITTSPVADTATSITVERATTMSTPSALPTAGVFMLITNNGADDKLIDVKSDIASFSGLHTTEVDNKGVMKMRDLKEIAIPAGKMTPLVPMGDHVMLVGMKNDKVFTPNEAFPITLVFEKAGTKTVQVEAVPPEVFLKRFPPELTGPARLKADEIRAKLSGKSEKSWTQRLRDRIRALGGETSAPPPPPALPSAEPEKVDAPVQEMPVAPAEVPDASAAPTITPDMTQDDMQKMLNDHSGHNMAPATVPAPATPAVPAE